MPRARWFLVGLLGLSLHIVLTACRSAEPSAATSTPFLSPLEHEVVREINLARTQPKAYAAFIEQLRPLYVRGPGQQPGGRTITTDGTRTRIITTEGPKALDEAIAFLHAMVPLPALTVSHGMSRGAKDHAQELRRTPALSHVGRDGSQPGDRANRYGRWLETFSENLAYGTEGARAMTIALIIDDGIPTRGHRTNMLSPRARWLGVGCGPHAAGTVCVTTFAGQYVDGAR